MRDLWRHIGKRSPSNDFQTANQKSQNARKNMIPEIWNLSNGFHDLNNVLGDDFGMGMCKLGNARNLTNMKTENFGESTSANKEFNRIFKGGSQKKLYMICKHMSLTSGLWVINPLYASYMQWLKLNYHVYFARSQWSLCNESLPLSFLLFTFINFMYL